MAEFKGTRGNWTRYTASSPNIERPTKHSVYTGTKRISLCYDLFESDKSKNVKEEEAQYNALLISKAPEMLDFINRISGEMLRNDFVLDEKWYEQAQQLIKEATEL